MLFTNPPKCSNHTSPIAPKIVSIFSAPQPRPLHLRLPENYIPQPPPEFFHCGELVVIEEEFENYKSSNRSSDTPVYRILRWYKESGPESSRRHYQLQNVRTMDVRGDTYEKEKLRLFPAQEGRGGEGEGERGRLGGKREWDAETLVGDDGDGGAASRDDETLRGDVDDDDDELSEAAGRG